MATKVQTEAPPIQHAPTANFETDLALEFLRVTEESAIAAGKNRARKQDADRESQDEDGTHGEILHSIESTGATTAARHLPSRRRCEADSTRRPQYRRRVDIAIKLQPWPAQP